jgi:alanine racemase
MRMRPVRYAIGTAMYGAAAARQITSMGVRYEPLLTLERSHRQIKDIGLHEEVQQYA